MRLDYFAVLWDHLGAYWVLPHLVVSTPKHRLSAVGVLVHHLFNDGVLEDWLEPSEHWGRIVRWRRHCLVARNDFVWDVSTA